MIGCGRKGRGDVLSGSHDPSPRVCYLAVTERAQSLFIELNCSLMFSLPQIALRQRLTHLYLSQVILCSDKHRWNTRTLQKHRCKCHASIPTCVSEPLKREDEALHRLVFITQLGPRMSQIAVAASPVAMATQRAFRKIDS